MSHESMYHDKKRNVIMTTYINKCINASIKLILKKNKHINEG